MTMTMMMMMQEKIHAAVEVNVKGSGTDDGRYQIIHVRMRTVIGGCLTVLLLLT